LSIGYLRPSIYKSDIFRVPALNVLVSFSFIIVMIKVDPSSIIRIDLYIYIYIYIYATIYKSKNLDRI